ncbi:MAG TPA: hypothetical protein VFS21_13780, partial [Roseiflexaceae bacterium]|nr:hypothetical protein [Roseiflexaceae bacterium]
IRTLAALLLGVAMLAHSTPAGAQAQSRICFPETGQCLEGRFRQFWEQNGGLPVFGYPITPARDEASPDDGKTYQTQWLERARFEYHPENRAPYDVLLGRLGRDALANRGVDWQTLPKQSDAPSGCRLFPETGHSLCDQLPSLSSGGLPLQVGFLSYWSARGLADPRLDRFGRSLALFGAPISDPQIEVNSSGRTVVAQYLERARLELPVDGRGVLQGRLGADLLAGEARPVALATGQGSPRTLVTTPEAVYWVSSGQGNQINRLPKSSGDAQTLAAEPGGVRGIAVDASGVYWTSADAVRRLPPGGEPGSLAGGQSSPSALAIDEGSVYWMNQDGSVNRVSKGGGSSTPLASGQDGIATGLAVDGADVYWVSQGRVTRVPKDGGPTTALAQLDARLTWRLALDGDSIYLAGYPEATAGGAPTGATEGVLARLSKADGLITLLYQGPERPLALAVSDGQVYWSTESGMIYRTPAGGGNTTLVVAGQDMPGSLAADQDGVYWANNKGGGAVMRASKR